MNVLGREGGKNLVEIGGLPAKDVGGDLRLVSVAVSKADDNVGFFRAMAANLAADQDVLPRDSVYPRGRPAEEVTTDDSGNVDVNSMRAAAAGLRAANHGVTDVPMVTHVMKNGPSDGLINLGDIIVAVDDVMVQSEAEVRAAIRKHKIGDNIGFRVLRDQNEFLVNVVSGAAIQGVLPVVGLTIENGHQFEPVVTFRVPTELASTGNGLVLALAVYGKIAEPDWSGLGVVAGAGAVQGDGAVTPIGGVDERIATAVKSGVQVFLLPEANCSDLTANPPGMRIVPVSDVKSAVVALEALRDPVRATDIKGCKYGR